MSKNKYIFDKQKAKLNQWQLLDVVDNDKEITQSNVCYYVGNEYPSFSMFYDEEKDCIREKTQYEKYLLKEYTLQDGEYIEDKEIKYKEKPKQDEWFWHWKDSEWQFDFIEWKQTLSQQLFNLRNQSFNKDITYNDFTFRMLPIDVENFKEKALQVSLGFAQLTDIVEWRLKNDEVHQFTLREILEVLALWGKRKVDIFEKFNKLYVKFMSILDENELREFMKEVENIYK